MQGRLLRCYQHRQLATPPTYTYLTLTLELVILPTTPTSPLYLSTALYTCQTDYTRWTLNHKQLFIIVLLRVSTITIHIIARCFVVYRSICYTLSPYLKLPYSLSILVRNMRSYLSYFPYLPAYTMYIPIYVPPLFQTLKVQSQRRLPMSGRPTEPVAIVGRRMYYILRVPTGLLRKFYLLTELWEPQLRLGGVLQDLHRRRVSAMDLILVTFDDPTIL